MRKIKFRDLAECYVSGMTSLLGPLGDAVATRLAEDVMIAVLGKNGADS